MDGCTGCKMKPRRPGSWRSKDVRVYYLTPPMIMFGLLLPFFLFFLILDQTRSRGGSGDCPTAGPDNLFHCLLGRASDHPDGTAHRHLRPPVGRADVAGHAAAGQDAGGGHFRHCGLGSPIGGGCALAARGRGRRRTAYRRGWRWPVSPSPPLAWLSPRSPHGRWAAS